MTGSMRERPPATEDASSNTQCHSIGGTSATRNRETRLADAAPRSAPFTHLQITDAGGNGKHVTGMQTAPSAAQSLPHGKKPAVT